MNKISQNEIIYLWVFRCYFFSSYKCKNIKQEERLTAAVVPQINNPQPIFISAPENRPMDLMHRRRLAVSRRNFAIANDNMPDMRRNFNYSIQNVWTPTAHHSHSHHHHHPGPMHQNRMHQPHNVPIQTGIINSGILLNFL